MKNDFIKFINDCEICAKTKFATRAFTRQTCHVTANAPHEKLCIDLIGKLPCSSSNFILSILDVYSKFLVLYPLKT